MADVTKITLLEDRVLVRAKGIEQKTASGIIIPDTATSEKPEQGEILSVGPGLVNEDGTVQPLTVKVGQMVLFTKYSPNEIKVDNEDFLIIREKDILAIVG